MNAKELGSAAAQVDAAVRHIEAHYDGPIPRLILTLGSGLAEIVAGLEASADFDYVSVPGFPVTRIDGHAGRLSMGLLCGVQVAVLRGREHYYERGWAGAMATPLRALRRLGAEQLVMTNAVGSLVVRAPPGSIVLMSDHINLSGVNPLVGDDYGTSPFVDMTNAYDSQMRCDLLAVADKTGVSLEEGVYACFSGPSFETVAEIHAARVLGADTVGMSVAAETTIARHCGLRAAALSVVTNFAAGIGPTAPGPHALGPHTLGHEQTMDAAAEAAPRLRHLIEQFLSGLAAT